MAEVKSSVEQNLRPSADLDWSVSPEGLRVAVSSWNQVREKIRILDLRNRRERNLQLPHGWYILNLSWAADGDSLSAAAKSKSTGFFIARIELEGKSHVLLNRGRNQWLG